jgi:ubiquinone/menaquinone biosynthesis C-methylase UbiE
MPEMNPVSRFFVNASSSWRTGRFYNWIRKEAPIPPAARCLEIGCGNGSLALRFVEGFRPAQYVATDFDPRQVEQARHHAEKRYPNGPPAALAFRTADMLGLSDGVASYDVVLAFVAIHHASPSHHDFTEIPRALSELDRVLRPGGLLVYGEILHQEAIRKWLTDHGFTIDRIRRRWRLETVVARKPGGPLGAAASPVGPASVSSQPNPR